MAIRIDLDAISWFPGISFGENPEAGSIGAIAYLDPSATGDVLYCLEDAEIFQIVTIPGALPQNNPCGSASMGQIRRELPSKGAVDQIVDGVSSYIDGVAWGATALAARTGLLGSNAQQQAISTNARLGTVLNQIASHPGQTASAVGAVASKYPLQMISRLGSGVAVSAGFTPYVGVPVSGLAVYGSAFKAAYQHPDAVAAAAVVGEMCP